MNCISSVAITKSWQWKWYYENFTFHRKYWSQYTMIEVFQERLRLLMLWFDLVFESESEGFRLERKNQLYGNYYSFPSNILTQHCRRSQMRYVVLVSTFWFWQRRLTFSKNNHHCRPKICYYLIIVICWIDTLWVHWWLFVYIPLGAVLKEKWWELKELNTSSFQLLK